MRDRGDAFDDMDHVARPEALPGIWAKHALRHRTRVGTRTGIFDTLVAARGPPPLRPKDRIVFAHCGPKMRLEKSRRTTIRSSPGSQ